LHHNPGPLKLTLEEEQADNAYWDNYFNEPKPEPMQESFNQWWDRLFQKQEDKQNFEGDTEPFSSAKTSSIVRSKTSTDFLHERTLDMARTRFDYAENGYKLGPRYLQTLNWARNRAIQMSPVLNAVLRDRLAHEHARRSKRLDEMKQAHANAILQGKCRSGRYCCAWHSHVMFILATKQVFRRSKDNRLLNYYFLYRPDFMSRAKTAQSLGVSHTHSDVILPMQDPYIDQIINGRKNYEFRNIVSNERAKNMVLIGLLHARGSHTSAKPFLR
jgi:hypothetical protein